MKNWFLEKSIAVRAAIIVLAAAVVTGIGAGVYMIVNHASSDRAEVAEIEDNTAPVVSPVINDQEETEETDAGNDEEVTEVAVIENKETETPEFEYMSYQKTSNRLENGNFADGLNAWEVYSFVNDNIDYTADDYFSITMQETGTEDWHVQLKQTGIRLEKGKWYTISFDAKSTLGRSITCAMQRDGMIHNDDWTPYANAKAYTLTSNWKTYTYTFQMNENTDNASVFMLSLGAINGRRLTTEHTICVDNIKLTQLADNWTDALKVGDNLIGNADFSSESVLWDASVVAPGAAQVSFDGNKATFDITNVGTVDWHVQLKQGAIKLANNQGYRLTFTVSSTTARTIKIGFMDTEYVNWYGGGDVVLNGTENQEVTVDFYNSIGANNNALFMLSMGKIEGVSTPAGKITLSNFKLVKCDSVSASAGGYGGGWTNPNHNLPGGWVVYDHESSHTNAIYESNGVYNISITNTGSEDWHVQMKNSNISLENGKWYKMSYEVKSSVDRNINVVIMKNGESDNDWTTYSTGAGVRAVGADWTLYETTFKMTSASDAHAIYNFALGKVNGQGVSGTHLVSIRNISVVETTEPVVPNRVVNVDGQVLNGDGAISESYYEIPNKNGNDVKIENGAIVANIQDPGTHDYDVQLKQTNLPIEKGAKYKVTLKASTTADRIIKVGFLSNDGKYTWYGGGDVNLSGNTVKTYTLEFTGEDTDPHGMMLISMGKIDGENTPASTITITEVSVIKIADAAQGNVISLSVISDKPNEYEGGVTFNPADYGVTDYIGKTLKVSIKIEATAYFGGAIGGNTSLNTDAQNWMNGAQQSEDNAGIYTWTQDIPKATGIVKLAIWWSGADEIKYSDVKIEVVDDAPANNDDGNANVPGNMLTALGHNVAAPATGTITESNGKYTVAITNAGSADWNVMISQTGIAMEKGASYEIKLTVESTVNRKIKVYVDNYKGDYDWFGGTDTEIGATASAQNITIPFTVSKDSVSDTRFGISMGQITAGADETGTIVISKISLVKTADAPVANNMLTSLGTNVAGPAGGGSAEGSITESNGTYTAAITNVGSADWQVSITQTGIPMEKGASYQIKLTVQSTVQRNIKVYVDNYKGDYSWFGGKEITIGTSAIAQTYTIDFTPDKDSTTDARFGISMGQLDGSIDETGTYIISAISLVKIAGAPEVVGLSYEENSEVQGATDEDVIIAEAEDIIADPEDVLSEPEDFVVDGDTASDDDEAEDIEELSEEAEAIVEAEVIAEETDELVFVDLDA